MEATVTPDHTRRFRRTAYVAALGAATGALITIGISALLTDDESSAERAPIVAVAAGHNLPATADAAEQWLTVERGTADARRSVPQSPDAAEHWIGIGVAPSLVAHLSADATEYWATGEKAIAAPSGVLPLSADAVEHWLTSR
jgi:hypothetical protein